MYLLRSLMSGCQVWIKSNVGTVFVQMLYILERSVGAV